MTKKKPFQLRLHRPDDSLITDMESLRVSLALAGNGQVNMPAEMVRHLIKKADGFDNLSKIIKQRDLLKDHTSVLAKKIDRRVTIIYYLFFGIFLTSLGWLAYFIFG